MSTENELRFCRLFDDVIACRDADERRVNAALLYSVECIVHDPTNGLDGEVVNGPAMVCELCKVYDTAFPDVEFRVLQTFDADGVVTGVWRCSGTHTGPFLGIEPRGKPFDVTAISIVRFEDERVAEVWQLADIHTLLEQIGAHDPGLRAGDMLPGRTT